MSDTLPGSQAMRNKANYEYSVLNNYNKCVKTFMKKNTEVGFSHLSDSFKKISVFAACVGNLRDPALPYIKNNVFYIVNNVNKR